MASKAHHEAAAEPNMERRIIRVEGLPDQAGIAAALRRAFAAAPGEDDSPFERELKQLLQRLN